MQVVETVAHTQNRLMKRISNDEFLAWEHSETIGFDQRYRPPHTLRYPKSLRLHLDLPNDKGMLEFLILQCLELVRNENLYLWKRGGRWVSDQPQTPDLY